jgi:opacity protein-like surface antigen
MMRWVLVSILILFGQLAQAQNRHVDIFGGFTTKDRLVVAQIARVTAGDTAFGVRAMQSDFILPDFDVGLGMSHTRKIYTNLSPNQIAATSLMVVAQYALFRAETITIYGGGGLGAVHLKHDDVLGGYANDAVILGGELTFGVRFQIASQLNLFIEGQYTRSKDVLVVNDPATRDAAFHNRAVVVGLRHSF